MVKKEAAAVASRSNKKLKDDSTKKCSISPKISALLEAIEEMKPDEKGVIFSQFTSFLDIVVEAFRSNRIPFERIDGSMNACRRFEAMTEFNAEGGPRFILCSLHAAGTGISLTRGNVVCVFLLLVSILCLETLLTRDVPPLPRGRFLLAIAGGMNP